jgi:hypothetical protein
VAEAKPPLDPEVRRQVGYWFLRRGVPLLVDDYSLRDVVPVVLPLLLALFGLELAAVPWVEADPIVQGLLIGAALCALVPTQALLLSAAGISSPVRESRARARQRSRRARWAVTALRLTPMAALVVALAVADTLGQVGVGGAMDLLVLLLLVLTALRMWRIVPSPICLAVTTAMIAIQTAVDLAWFHVDATPLDLPPSTVAAPFAALVFTAAARRSDAPAESRSARLLSGLRGSASMKHATKLRNGGSILFLILAFQATIAPWLHGTTTLGAILSLLGGPLVVVVLFAIFVRLATPAEVSAALAGRDRLRWRALIAIGLAFVSVPVCIVVALDPDYALVDNAALVLATTNALVLLVLIGGASVGLNAIASWAGSELKKRLAQSGDVILHGAPLALVFIFFFLFTTETWDMAATLSDLRFWSLTALIVALGLLVVFVGVFRQVPKRYVFATADDAQAALEGVEDEAVLTVARISAARPNPPLTVTLTLAQRLNLTLVATIKWTIPMLIVSVTVSLAVLALAAVSIDSALLEAWDDGLKDEVPFSLIVRVVAFLGAFSAFYFLVESLREAQRANADEHLPDVDIANVDNVLTRRLAALLAYRNAATAVLDEGAHIPPPA